MNTSANSASTRSRAPKGVPTGGQFVTDSKAEPSVGLADPNAHFDSSPDAISRSLQRTYRNTAVRTILRNNPDAGEQYRNLQEVVESRHPDPSEVDPQIVSSQDARDRARAVLPHLPEDEFNYRWARVEQAAARHMLYLGDDGPDAALNADPRDELFEFDPDPDRSGERSSDDDDEEYAHELSDAWGDLTYVTTWEAVEADREHAKHGSSPDRATTLSA